MHLDLLNDVLYLVVACIRIIFVTTLMAGGCLWGKKSRIDGRECWFKGIITVNAGSIDSSTVCCMISTNFVGPSGGVSLAVAGKLGLCNYFESCLVIVVDCIYGIVTNLLNLNLWLV